MTIKLQDGTVVHPAAKDSEDSAASGRRLKSVAAGAASARGARRIALAEVERHARPLSREQLELSVEQMYGPPGTSAFLA